MKNSQKRAKILIVILLILNLIGLIVIGFLLYEINTMKEPNIIADTGYSNIETNMIANNKQDNNALENNLSNNIEQNNIINENNNWNSSTESNGNENSGQVNLNTISEWELTLVNYENSLSEDFNVELSSIDKTRKFDSRAIKYLNNMLLDMKAQNVKGIWVQSAYRSIESQTRVFNEEIQKQMKLRKIKKRSGRMCFKSNK